MQARFEERGIFAVAPTTILGMSTRYSLGERGSINLIGLYQREQSAFNRPALGFEATANLIGGVNTELHFRPQAISRFLNSLTSSPTTAPSLLDVNAEFAFTKPDPNRSGEAYLEEFESEAGLQISLREAAVGVRQRAAGAPLGLEDIGFGAAFDPADAVALTWQNLVPDLLRRSSARSSSGRRISIPLIRLAGPGRAARGMCSTLTLHADTAGGIVQRDNQLALVPAAPGPRPAMALDGDGAQHHRPRPHPQRVPRVLGSSSPPGEPARLAGLRLVVDLGTVNEDAIALAPDTMTVNGADTVFTGRQYVGLGRARHRAHRRRHLQRRGGRHRHPGRPP